MTLFRRDVMPPPRAVRDRPEPDLSVVRLLAATAWDKGEALATNGDLPAALAWLGRAHRIAPADQNLRFSLACLRLRAGDADGAATLFADMAARHDVRACWTGLASACLQVGRLEEAVAAMQRALSGHALDAAASTVAARVVQAAGLPGWCGVREDGILVVDAAASVIRLDGQLLAPEMQVAGKHSLPAQWRRAHRLAAACGGTDMLGSPVALDALSRVEGFVERRADGIGGWAWLPGSPGIDPELYVIVHGKTLDATVHTPSDVLPVEGTRPLARPRGFALSVAASVEIHVIGSDGRHLLGSPLPPAGQVSGPMPPTSPSTRLAAARLAEPELAVDVIIPVHRGLRTTLDCLDTVMASVAAPHRIVVVDDASPEPVLVSALEALAASGAILLVRPPVGTGGFPAAANAGMQAARGRHVVLLNSDTLVAPGWLDALRDAACSAPDIGTATPLSNEASIFSVPDPAGGNPAPDLAGTRDMAALAARANGGLLVDVPTAHGFCMFIRRDCLEATGGFDTALFAQGYGEENDFCERARALGYRHVAVPGLYVAHLGGVSFGGAGRDLLRRNLALLAERHSDYLPRVAQFIAADPLFPARRRLDGVRWQVPPRAPSGSVLLITHGGGGGTARVVAERQAALRADGFKPIILQPREGLCEVGDGSGSTPNLAFALPAEIPALRQLLAADHPVAAELHHLLGHDHALLGLLVGLGIPYDVWVHDYGWVCARLSFVTGDGRFCGEAPPNVCDTCLARWGREIEDPIDPAALRARSAADLLGARRIVVPSADVARRVLRHVPGAVPEIRPWEAPPPFRPASVRPGTGRRRVAVIGAIGLEKGVQVLLACAQDAAARGLDLEFVVVGYTSDDAALLATGCVFVTGAFGRHDAGTLIASQAASLAFLPSIWPETWCYALSDAWAAGLSAAVFDIGTPADRVREGGAGWVLPLGLPAPRVNDVLLSL